MPGTSTSAARGLDGVVAARTRLSTSMGTEAS